MPEVDPLQPKNAKLLANKNTEAARAAELVDQRENSIRNGNDSGAFCGLLVGSLRRAQQVGWRVKQPAAADDLPPAGKGATRTNRKCGRSDALGPGCSVGWSMSRDLFEYDTRMTNVRMPHTPPTTVLLSRA